MTDLTQLRVSAASKSELRIRKHQRKKCRKKLWFDTMEEAEIGCQEKSAKYNIQFYVYQCRGSHYHLTKTNPENYYGTNKS